VGARENKSKYANKQKGLILMKDRSQERRIKIDSKAAMIRSAIICCQCAIETIPHK